MKRFISLPPVARSLLVEVPAEDPELCAKLAALGATVGLEGRLLSPMIGRAPNSTLATIASFVPPINTYECVSRSLPTTARPAIAPVA